MVHHCFLKLVFVPLHWHCDYLNIVKLVFIAVLTANTSYSFTFLTQAGLRNSSVLLTTCSLSVFQFSVSLCQCNCLQYCAKYWISEKIAWCLAFGGFVLASVLI